MPPPIRLTLHIGLHKTGTTLIQQALRELRPPLREHGIVHVDRLDILELTNLRGWRAFNRPKPKLRDAFIGELRDLVSSKANEPAESSPADHVLISNEALVGVHSPNYTSPFRPKAEPAILDVIEALEPQTTHLVLYVRRQDRLIESAYMQRIHAGQAYSFEKYLSRIDDGPIIDFEDLVGRLEELPTVSTVATRPFEFIGAGSKPFVSDFLEAAALPAIDLSGVGELPRSNPSYTAPAYQAALTINRNTTKKQQPGVRAFLKRIFPIGEYPRAVLFDEAQRDECLDLYREVNERFFSRRHPELPPDAYSNPQATERLGSYLATR